MAFLLNTYADIFPGYRQPQIRQAEPPTWSTLPPPFTAPFSRDSGPHRGKRKVWGGWAKVRASLYMGALVATRCNPALRPFYQRLLASGKAKKLALTACMRKLLTMLNSMVRNGERWDPTVATN